MNSMCCCKPDEPHDESQLFRLYCQTDGKIVVNVSAKKEDPYKFKINEDYFTQNLKPDER